jgi:Tol biopolymer transport system component
MRSILLRGSMRLCSTSRLALKFSAPLFLGLAFGQHCDAQTPPRKGPDPKFWIVFDAHANEDTCNPQDIYVTDLKGEHVKRLTSNHRSHNPSWSPDGSRIVFLQDERMPIGGPNPKYYSCGCTENFLHESHDVYWMSANGGSPSLVTAIGPDAQDTAWVPDGEHIAVRMADKENLLVHVVSTQLPPNHQSDMSLSQFLALQEPQECVCGANVIATDPPMDNFLPDFYTSLYPFTGPNYPRPSHGPQFSADLGTSLRVVSLAGAATPAPVPAFDTSWSPDGQRIAYSFFTGKDLSILYVADVHEGEAGAPRGLTKQELDANGPGWSTDGLRIAFAGVWKGTSQIFIINADGTNLVQLSSDAKMRCDHVSWSPDDKWIVATCDDVAWRYGDGFVYGDRLRQGQDFRRPTIYLFDTGQPGAKPRQVVKMKARNPSFAPAGTVIR